MRRSNACCFTFWQRSQSVRGATKVSYLPRKLMVPELVTGTNSLTPHILLTSCRLSHRYAQRSSGSCGSSSGTLKAMPDEYVPRSLATFSTWPVTTLPSTSISLTPRSARNAYRGSETSRNVSGSMYTQSSPGWNAPLAVTTCHPSMVTRSMRSAPSMGSTLATRLIVAIFRSGFAICPP